MNKTTRVVILMSSLSFAVSFAATPVLAQVDGNFQVNLPAPPLPSFLSGKPTIVPPKIGGGTPASLPGVDGSVSTGPGDANNPSASMGGWASGGDTGDTGRSSAKTPWNLSDRASTDRGVPLPKARYSNLAPSSVDPGAVPSGAFKYGFPNEPQSLFMGVSRGSVGGFLPPVSTASVDFNTVDCPIRGPLYPFGRAPNTAAPPIQIYVPLPGGGSITGAVNTNQALGSIRNFINGGP